MNDQLLFYLTFEYVEVRFYVSAFFTFQASSYQAAILMCFNTRTQYPVVELQQMVGTERPYFDQILVLLLKSKVLIIKEETEEVDEKDLLAEGVTVKLNVAFKRYNTAVHESS